MRIGYITHPSPSFTYSVRKPRRYAPLQCSYTARAGENSRPKSLSFICIACTCPERVKSERFISHSVSHSCGAWASTKLYTAVSAEA